MLILYFREFLFQFDLISKVFHCIGLLLLYIIPCLAVLVPIRFLTNIPSFIFRKLLHMVAITGVSLMILSSGSWQAAVVVSLLIAAVICPLLALFEKEEWYARLLVQKSPGEIKKSLFLLSLTFAVLITVTWGIFGSPATAAASVQMWGLGDAAAALVGIPFGKHKVHLGPTDGKKSWEGSCAMFVTSFVTGVLMLSNVMGLSVGKAVFCALFSSLAGTITELYTASEYDTVSVPLVIGAVLLLTAAIL